MVALFVSFRMRHNLYPVFGGPADGRIMATTEMMREGLWDEYHTFNSGSKDKDLPSMIFMHKSNFKE
jgi:hypothetical protein